MLKHKGQILLATVGLISFGLAILTLLKTQTLIFSPGFLAFIYGGTACALSLVLGFLTRKVFRAKWTIISLTSVYLTIISVTYIIIDYSPTHKIIVPDNYSGQVKLFLSKSSEDNFILNKYGVGYLSKDTYYKGFHPKVIQGGQDITDKVFDFSEGSMSGSFNDKPHGTFKYLGFVVKARNDSVDNLEILINNHALDTAIIEKNYY